MGIDIYESRFLVECHRDGVSFSDSLMIGRQTLALSRKSLAYVFNRMGYSLSEAQIAGATAPPAPYRYPFSEDFFRLLGAQRVDSLDHSSYEGATIVAALDGEIPPDIVGKYSAVIDCGTLEHVFDCLTGLRNTLSCVSPGGHYLGILPCNNTLGHGFYQFSPEFFFRQLTPENGFKVEKIYLCERVGTPKFYRLRDPAEVGARVDIETTHMSYLMVCARRVGELSSGSCKVVQSDYELAWTDANTGNPTTQNPRDRLVFKMKQNLPPSLFELIRRVSRYGAHRRSLGDMEVVPW